MTNAYAFAVMIFGAGFFVLLAWLYVTADNPRSNTLVLKSIGLFVLPGIPLALIPPRWLAFPFAALVATFIEECLKAIAAATEENRTDRFWLISLFGIWELMLAKPLWGIGHAGLLQDWTLLELVGLAAGAVITILMHAITAKLYAFRLAGNIALALFVSWVVHSTFNLSVDWLGVSLVACMVQLMPLVLIFLALWPNGTKPHLWPSS